MSFPNSFGSSLKRCSRIYIQGVPFWYQGQLLTLRFLQKQPFETEELEAITSVLSKGRTEAKVEDGVLGQESRLTSPFLLPVSALNRVRFI